MPNATATKVSAVVNGAAVYDLNPPLEQAGETHARVIVAAKYGQTNVFPVTGPIRVVHQSPTEHTRTAIGDLGYRVA